MTDGHDGINRRRFLNRAAATGALAVGASAGVGTASARQVESTAVERAAFEDALDAHGDGLRDLLAAEGVLAETGALNNPRRRDIDGRPDQFAADLAVEDGFLAVVVEPGEDRAFAALTHDSGDEVTFYEGGEVVTQQVEPDACYCTTDICPKGLYYFDCCQDGDCYPSECSCY